jgi:preprotein translocase subunit SecG
VNVVPDPGLEATVILPLCSLIIRLASDNAANTLLKQPGKQKVIHHHYMNRALWAVAILFNVVIVLIVFLSNARDQINENRESDVRYRQMKLNNDKNLRNILQQTDSLYLADPAQMTKNVIREEERRKDQAELMRQAEEKKMKPPGLKKGKE